MFNDKLTISKNNNEFALEIKKNITIITFVVPYGFESKEMDVGYAHLLEHMIIKSNQNYFDYLENRGVNYNAETQDNQIVFTFIDFDRKVLKAEVNKIRDIFKVKFKESEFESEKKVIEQEYLYQKNKYSEDSIKRSIGSLSTISEFNLNKLNQYKKYISEKVKLLFIDTSPNDYIKGNTLFIKSNIELDWYKKINILEVDVEKNNMEIKLEKNIYSDILVYNLKVINEYTIEKSEIKILNDKNYYYLIISDNLEKILLKAGNKKKAFTRYYLLLDTIKILSKECIYFITNMDTNYDLKRCYYDNWEGWFIEQIAKR